ncbi:MAG: hypothetical protein ACR2MQ_09760 [Gemmatimonadaceae bacterium]
MPTLPRAPRCRSILPFAVFALMAVGLCGVTYAINAHYDISALDQSALITRLAALQTDSDLLVWQNAFDQRAWLRERLEDPRSNHEVVLIGSSTIGGLSAAMFPARTLLNGWLSAPTIEDFEAATVLLDRASHRPQTVVLGIDAWFLNPVIDDQRWRSLTDEFIRYRRQQGDGMWVSRQRPLGLWAMLKERLTFATLRETALFVRDARRSSEPLIPWLVRATPAQYCLKLRTPEYIRTLVGDYVSCPALQSPQATVDSEAVTYVARNTHSMADWTQVDVPRAQRLAAVVRHIRSMGVNVVLVAPPYHPSAYAALYSNTVTARNLNETDRLLSSVARRTGAVYLNLRNPEKLGCATSDFLDSHHTKPSCGRKISAHVVAAISGSAA